MCLSHLRTFVLLPYLKRFTKSMQRRLPIHHVYESRVLLDLIASNPIPTPSLHSRPKSRVWSGWVWTHAHNVLYPHP